MPANRWMVINPSRYEDLQSASPQSLAVGGLAKTGDVLLSVVQQVRLVVLPFLAAITSTRTIQKFAIVSTTSASRVMALRLRTVSISSTSDMHYLEPTLQRGGIVHINLEFTQNGERSVYQQDVQVLNVP